MDASISPAALRQSLQCPEPPLVIDVRRERAFLDSPYLLEGALRRDPDRVAEWAPKLPPGAVPVVYCVHGHELSQGVARALGARFLEGGIEGWKEGGGALAAKPQGAPTRWITRERPKIDRIACPWLVRRFVDAEAEFLYVAAPEVRRLAQARQAVPYDIAGVAFSHDGERCSFDAFLLAFRLRDPALARLALIVRGADTERLDLAPEVAGLLALSLGLSRVCPDDHEMLARGMMLYDALYEWCKAAQDEPRARSPE